MTDILSDSIINQDDRCAFSNTLISEHYQCSKAQSVVRRGGSEISCSSSLAARNCCVVYDKLKNISIPVFDVADDLLSMPHGVKVKIQHGGLVGLNVLTNGEESLVISDISQLISDSEDKFTSFDKIPYEQTIDFITSYKTRRKNKNSSRN